MLRVGPRRRRARGRGGAASDPGTTPSVPPYMVVAAASTARRSPARSCATRRSPRPATRPARPAGRRRWPRSTSSRPTDGAGADVGGPGRSSSARCSTPGRAPPRLRAGVPLAGERTGRRRADEAVVHGDFRLGNLIVDDDGLRAVLDWELAHVGDPMEDLGWLCVQCVALRSPLRRWAGSATYDELVAAYSAASGRPVDPEVVRWWEVLGTLKWGIMCMHAGERPPDGHGRAAMSWPPSAGGCARTSTTCSSCCA